MFPMNTPRTYEAALASLQLLEAREDAYRSRYPIHPFLVRMTAQVIIRQAGQVREVLEPGDVLVATARCDTSQYFVSSPVSVYYSEAEAIDIEREAEDHIALLGYN